MSTKIILNNATVKIPIYDAQSFIFKKRLVGSHKFENKSVVALNNINISLKRGDRLGLIGGNGAGKTSLLKTIAGIYPLSSGIINVEGKISSLIDIYAGMDLDATGFENIKMRSLLMGQSFSEAKRAEDDIADFCGLGDFLYMPIRTYSTGMHMRLGFSIITAFKADIVLMDEWLSVGDKYFIKKAEKRLESFISESSILVLASHSETVIKKMTNKVLNLGFNKPS